MWAEKVLKTTAVWGTLKYRDGNDRGKVLTMPRVYFTSLHGENWTLSAARDLFARHGAPGFSLARTIGEAEIVLYVESGYVGIPDIPQLFRGAKAAPGAKHFMFCESDWPYPLLPGMYPNVGRRYSWAHSWAFFPRHEWTEPVSEEPNLLFSFAGRTSTHPVREAVVELNGPETPCRGLTGPSFGQGDGYRELIEKSRFVLCPRGLGVASFRIFETMSAGRVPVIIADEWLEPDAGRPWSEFSIRVPEAGVDTIPVLLRSAQPCWKEMGNAARQVYEERFSSRVFLSVLLSRLTERFAHCHPNILWRATKAVRWWDVRAGLAVIREGPKVA